MAGRRKAAQGLATRARIPLRRTRCLNKAVAADLVPHPRLTLGAEAHAGHLDRNDGYAYQAGSMAVHPPCDARGQAIVGTVSTRLGGGEARSDRHLLLRGPQCRTASAGCMGARHPECRGAQANSMCHYNQYRLGAKQTALRLCAGSIQSHTRSNPQQRRGYRERDRGAPRIRRASPSDRARRAPCHRHGFSGSISLRGNGLPRRPRRAAARGRLHFDLGLARCACSLRIWPSPRLLASSERWAAYLADTIG